MAHETNHLRIYCDPMDVATFFLPELGPAKDMQMVALCLQCMRKMTLSHRRSTESESSGGATVFCVLVFSVGGGCYIGPSNQESRLERRIRDQLDPGQVVSFFLQPGFSLGNFPQALQVIPVELSSVCI